jgi:ABC-type lipoprotein release transport system permease subunit
MFIVRLALRNLRRNLRRTLITGLAIGFGLALLIVSSGFGDGTHGQMIASGIGAMAGHVVVQGPGWQQRREADIVVPNSSTVRAKLAKVAPDATVVGRVFLQGLLTSPRGSAGVQLSAVEPEREREVDDLHAKIVEGTYLDGNRQGIVLGKTLAETLGVGIGDKLVLMAQRRGEIESRLMRVQGIFRVGIDEIDGFHGQLPLATAQELLGLGSEVTQLSLHLKSQRTVQETLASTVAALKGEKVEVLAWDEALPDLSRWVALDDGFLYVFMLVIAVIVAMGITNTVLMSVLERMRELGVLLAVGMTPRRLWLMVVTEGALLGLFSVVAGAGVGLLLNWPLAVWGIDYGGLAGGGDSIEAAGVALAAHQYSDLSGVKVVVFAVLAFAMTVLASLYPAFKAARLRPIRCLQHR